ncbi:hypothetical protein VNO78_33233 [Psophocarpus tetragonolobus]|uniref:BHLH domain-containing protein n=1 Tax=Psophocarpus tetragonolobus TaxID=3891 RepID=A0AAN9RS79_PSOTE
MLQWTEPQSEAQNAVVMGDGALLPSFRPMLDGDWYSDQSHYELLQNGAFLPQQQQTGLESGYHCGLGSQSGFLAQVELSSNPEFAASQLGVALRWPLEAIAPSALYCRRAERWREVGKAAELVPPPVVEEEGGKMEENGLDGNDGDGNGGVEKRKKKGMPAKNLMAERRRRKKLNDRLYMLRSVVPKISKMDRASILGDAIEYLRELLMRITYLHHELELSPPGSSLQHSASFCPVTPTLPCRVKEELCPTSLPSPKNQSPKVEVSLREGRAVNIHMFCASRPGLLLSTMKALDNLGLDVQQAVISCFNGFALDVFRAEDELKGRCFGSNKMASNGLSSIFLSLCLIGLCTISMRLASLSHVSNAKKAWMSFQSKLKRYCWTQQVSMVRLFLKILLQKLRTNATARAAIAVVNSDSETSKSILIQLQLWFQSAT